MSRSELSRMLGSIAAVFTSYAAAFWLLTLPHRQFNFLSRIGYVSALYCVMGVGIFFWANVLAPIGKKRRWSQRNCQYAPLITIIPGCVLFLAGGFTWAVANLLMYQALFTRFCLAKLLYPNTHNDSPFETDSLITLFPR